MKIGMWFLVVAMAYAVAILCKAVSVLARRVPYTFTQWDGGLMLRGKTLHTKGTIAFALVMAGLGAFAAYHFVQWSRLP